MAKVFTERELILLDTALTSFIEQRKGYDVSMYEQVREKIMKMIKER